jgi:hypothetical protein
MADYALLYSGGGMPETEEETARVMKAWNDWYEDLGKAIKDGGNPFGAAKTVGSDGSLRDGATGSPFTGYTILSAESLDRAAELAKGSPALQGGGSITVYEIVEVM